jgi:hypothetical protein
MATDLTITLKFATPAGPFEGVFDATAKVHDRIAIVVKEKHLAAEDQYELVRDGVPLDSDKALSALDIKDEAVLDLVASGSAV